MPSFLKNMMKLFLGTGQSQTQGLSKDAYSAVKVYVKCSKCGEAIALRIRKSDEIQRADEGNGYTFYVQKLIVGNKCYNRMPMRLELDSSYKVVNRSIQGGMFISEDEYESCRGLVEK